MFFDIYSRLNVGEEPDFLVARELLYADDTVLMSSYQNNLQQLVNEIVIESAKYGLELNWSKTFQMNVWSAFDIRCPDGSILQKNATLLTSVV